MRWLFLVIGGVATAAMLLISMRLNFLFGSSLGQKPELQTRNATSIDGCRS